MTNVTFRTVCGPLGVTIQCDTRRWMGHILQEHPALIGHEAEVEQAIANPDAVTQDAGSSRRRCFYKFNVGLSPYAQHLKVVVEFRRFRQRGYVVTAYPVDRLKSSEALLWQRPPPPPPPTP